jgi:gliding motility-associated-like protein
MKLLLLSVILLFNLTLFSQEICNNGIDDDGDGFIDLLDGDCNCTTTINSSLVPNYNFEEYNNCPTDASQLYRAISWSQGTFSRPSYFNKCGFILPDIYNYPDDQTDLFPSGNGIAGATMSTPYNEYIKSTLTEAIPAGANCQLKMKIAAIIYKNHPGEYELDISELTPVNLTIYGSPILSGTPVGTFTSPNINGSPWIEIGSATYIPKAKWQDLIINFTTEIEVREIMIGAPEILPSAYYVPLMAVPASFPYFLYDDIILNKLSDFDLYINKTGNLCSNDLILTANLNTTTSGNIVYQWYKGELPILLNGNSSTFNVSNSLFLNKGGDYSVKIFDDINCYTSSITINTISESPNIILTPPNCTNLASILITDTAEEYSIDNGLTWSSNPLFTSLLPGVYYIITKNNNCTSNYRTVTIPGRIPNLPNPTVTTNQPNSCADIGEIIINTSADLYSFDNGNTWTTNNTLQNAPPGNYYILIKDLYNCTSLPIQVILNSYTNNSSPPIGDMNQFFCVNENATLEDINVSGMNIKWYDAAIGGNLLSTSTLLQDGQFYYCSQSVNNCESQTRLEIKVHITSTLNANDYNAIMCDEGNNGIEYIDISNYNTNLSSSTNYSFKYYTSYEGADSQLPIDEITNFDNYELHGGNTTLFVRISNQGACTKIVKLNLNLISSPSINISDTLVICNQIPIEIDAGSGYDQYNWSTNETSNSIWITQVGEYSVTVSNIYSSLTCSTTKNFSVINSITPTISEIITSNWIGDNNDVTILLSSGSIGDYEYSLDGIHFQNSNTFNGLAGGEYTVYVKDKNDCGIIEYNFYLLTYPKFFTPNGDGHNDTWKVKFSQFKENFVTQIFDRYGKLIKVLKNHESWDGNYDGKQLPSDDYWFQITRSDGRIHKGHFSLKR